MNLSTIIKHKRGEDFSLPYRLLSLDPGHTTGWALFVNGSFYNAGTSNTVLENKIMNWEAIETLFDIIRPTCVVCEDYRMYADKSQQHIGQPVYTLRLIGVIEYLCYLKDIPIYYQMASHAKSFWKDAKLKQLGINVSNKHARDAVRHACNLLAFNKDYKGEI